MNTDKYQMDMCSGPLFSKILRFAFPLMITYWLHLLFNTADLVVIGHFAADHRSIAGIGSTINLNALMINLFIGLSIGTNVLVARHFGAKDTEKIRKAVHTSILMAIWGGLGLMVVSILLAKPLLVLMKTPADVMPFATTYVIICFAATPFILLYNTGCAILRAVGDTKRPMLFLIIAGSFNVVMNLVFVIVFKMDVAGVAIATMLSHGISAALVLRVLLTTPGEFRLEWKYLHFDKQAVKEVLQIGIPAGVQSSSFSVSNMLIQSTINSFGSLAIAGNTAAIGLEGLINTGSGAFHQASLSFTAQNLGGKKFDRLFKSMMYCLITSLVLNQAIAMVTYYFGSTLLGFFDPDPAVIDWGLRRIKYMMLFFAAGALMDAATGSLRGMGYSFISAMICLSAACVFRIIWIFCVFPHFQTYENIIISYPISWALAGTIGWITLMILYPRVVKKNCRPDEDWSRYVPGPIRGLRFFSHSR